MRVSRRLFSCAEWGAPGIAGAGCQPGEIAIPPLGQTDTSGLNRGIDRVILPLRTGRNHSAQQSDHGRQLAHGYEADGQGSAENRTQEAPHACPHSSPQRLIVGAVSTTIARISGSLASSGTQARPGTPRRAFFMRGSAAGADWTGRQRLHEAGRNDCRRPIRTITPSATRHGWRTLRIPSRLTRRDEP
jgi:hypothetical protein